MTTREMNLLVQEGVIDTTLTEIPVGPKTVSLFLQDGAGETLWSASVEVVVEKRETADAVLRLQREGDRFPDANFTVTPAIGQLDTVFQVQAEVSDTHDPTDSLRVRWDFDNDGTFEVDWTYAKEASHTYARTGNFTISLEARDRSGNISSKTQPIQVVDIRAILPDSLRTPLNDLIELDGSASVDIPGQSLIYHWSQVVDYEGAHGSVLNTLTDNDRPTAVSPSFKPEFGQGRYVFTLQVEDGPTGLQSDPDTLIVLVSSTPPVASVSTPDAVEAGQPLTLQGQATDADGDALSYRWRGEYVEMLSDTTNLTPTFTAAAPGEYRFSLVAIDTDPQESEPAEAVVTVVSRNAPPVANAGIDVTPIVGDVVQLDGRESRDPEETSLSYTWTQKEGPSVTLQGSDTATPSFTPAEADRYVFSLVVSDGEKESPPDDVVVTVQVNQVPVADAGADQVVQVGGNGVLDGSGSQDAERMELAYQWTAPAGISLSSTTAVQPPFTADVAGSYPIILVVNDGYQNSAPDTVAIRVNTPPVANAGTDQKATVGAVVQLNGSGSADADGDGLSYRWTAPAGVVLSDGTVAQPTFEAKAVGTYRFSLVVSDGYVDSASDTVEVAVTQANRAPVADAGVDQSVKVGTAVQLDGSRSRDADGDTLNYQWSQIAGPVAVSFSDALIERPTVTPLQAGMYQLALVVNDGQANSAPDTLYVFVRSDPPEIISVAAPEVVEVGQTVALQVEGRDDLDDDLVYRWRGEGVEMLSDSTSARPVFAPVSKGKYRFSVVAVDGDPQESTPREVVIQVPNRPPVAVVSGGTWVQVGEEVTLQGDGSSDPDGDELSFEWQQTAGPGVTLEAAGDSAVSFVPETAGSYAFVLEVSDGEAVAADTLEIEVYVGAEVVVLPGRLDFGTVTVGESESRDVWVKNGGDVQLEGLELEEPGAPFSVSVLLRDLTPGDSLLVQVAFVPVAGEAFAGEMVLRSQDREIQVSVAGRGNVPPVAALSVVPEAGTLDTVFAFDASGSRDAEGALRFRWDWEDDGMWDTEYASGSSTVHSFAAKGEQTVRVEVVDEDGVTATAVASVRVVNVPPVVDAGANQTVVRGIAVTLRGTAEDADGDALSWVWREGEDNPERGVLSDVSVAQPVFTPSEEGVYRFVVEVNDGEVSVTDSVAITVERDVVVVQVDVTAIDFGEVKVGEQAEREIKVTNVGTVAGEIGARVDSPFVVDPGVLELGPEGGQGTLRVVFSPEMPGDYVDTLQVGEEGGSSVEIQVSGRGLGGVLSVTPDTLDFGVVEVGQIRSLDLALVNDGNTTLQVSDVAVGAPFSAASQSLTVVAGGSRSLSVVFAPTGRGSFSGKLLVCSNGGDAVVWLTGRGNAPPVADAGADRTVDVGVTVTLDGSGSSDADGDALTYQWSAPAGVALSSVTAVRPTFIATAAGTYRFTLVVRDGYVNSIPDTVVVTVSNRAPVANAGVDQTVNVGVAVTLDGSGSSDADGDVLTYQWSAPAGIVLSSATVVKPTFTANTKGTYRFSLVVNDGRVNSSADEVVVTVSNRAPVANAGVDQTVNVGVKVTLDGSGSSDADGDVLTYQWSAPAGIVLSSATVVKPTFTASAVGTYRFSLVVNDGKVASSADEVVVTVSNRAPVANAGVDQTVNVGVKVTLDGSGSSDADGDRLTYQWTEVASNPVVVLLSDVASSRPTFTASKEGKYQFRLVVNDGTVGSSADEVVVIVRNPPLSITSINVDPSIGKAPLKVTFSPTLTGGDPPFIYAWDFGDGYSSTEFSPDHTYSTVQTYAVKVTVTDADGDTATKEVTVDVVSGSIVADLPYGVKMEFLWIDGGTFTMGSPSTESGRWNDEGPQHQVTISKGFYLGKYEVTQEQWQTMMGTIPWEKRGQARYGVQENPNNPAVYLSWDEAEEMVHKLNVMVGDSLYRLPTEAEWEYASRAGTTTRWSFGDDESQLGNYAWYRDNAESLGEDYAHQVGTKKPNLWGLYDMHGNVDEWVQDFYGPYSSDAQVDPQGPSTGDRGRSLRGGDFESYATHLRSATRSATDPSPGNSQCFIGFRLLRVK